MSRTPTRRGLFRALAAFAGACGLGVVPGQRPAQALTERQPRVSFSPGPFPPLYDARCRVDGEFTATFNDSRLYEAVVRGQAELDAEAGKTIADCAERFCDCCGLEFRGSPKIG